MRKYRGFCIKKQMDNRWDVFKNEGSYTSYPIVENFITLSEAMIWIDETQFN